LGLASSKLKLELSSRSRTGKLETAPSTEPALADVSRVICFLEPQSLSHQAKAGLADRPRPIIATIMAAARRALPGFCLRAGTVVLMWVMMSLIFFRTGSRRGTAAAGVRRRWSCRG